MENGEVFHSTNKVKHALDISEKLLSQLTVQICFVFAAIVGYKTYVTNPISCHASTEQSGENFIDYMVNYCWAKGTYVINDQMPSNDKEWEKLNPLLYYPWIPLILFIQALMFALPNLVWVEFIKSRYGDLNKFFKSITDMRNECSSSSTFSENMGYVADEMEKMLYMGRDFRHGFTANIKRRISKKCSFLFFSKRQGNALVSIYFFVKIFSAIICILQIMIMKRVLQLNNQFFDIYYQVFKHIVYGGEWPESSFFPRVTFCRSDGIRSAGVNDNTYVAQCVLTINILNEKVYIFLFLWISILLMIVVYYLLLFIIKVAFKCNRVNYIKHSMKMHDVYRSYDKMLIDKFVCDFLRMDGVFILMMIRQNAGERAAVETIWRLWKVFKDKYRQINLGKDNRNYETTSISFKLNQNDETNLKLMPTAPCQNQYM